MSNQAPTGHRSAGASQGGEDFKPRIMPTPCSRYSRSLEYGVAILECFTADRPALRISELADMVGISRSTTHRYASTLVDLGRLEQDGKRRYRLAREAARPGTALIDTIRLQYPARTVLEDLRAQTGFTVSLGLLDGSRALYVYRLHGHRAGQNEADGDLAAGAHVSVYDTAIGKALLSSLIDSELGTLFPAIELSSHTPDVSMDGYDAEEIEAELRLLAEIEQAITDKIALHEDGAGVLSIAAPVPRWLGKPIFAVELTASASACTMEELVARAGGPAKHAARFLSV